MFIRSRAPVRIDFAGGWTDVALFTAESKGLVVNAAINLYSYATLRGNTQQPTTESGRLQQGPIQKNRDSRFSKGWDEIPTQENRKLDKRIRIYSADFDLFIEAEDVRKLEYDGNIDLVKAAIRRMSIKTGGFDLITQSNAPPGSGLGTSAAMGIALIGVLGAFTAAPLLPYEYAELASAIEKQELGILGGKQDHYASAIGGIRLMEFMGEDVKTARLPIAPDIQYELEKNLVLCYTGKSRLSGDIHQKVTDAYTKGEEKTREALRNLKSIAEAVKKALMQGKLSDFGHLLNANWENQKALHPSVTNDQIDRLFDIAMTSGAIGGKACGAGGGGCLLFYCQPDQEHHVRRQLEEAGGRIIDFSFDFEGLRIWRSGMD